MKKYVIVMLVLAGAVLAGCQKEEGIPAAYTVEAEPILAPPTQEEAEPEEETADTAVIQERTVVDGKMQSYLTGEWKDEEVARRRSMAVMIPNNKPALPQYGLSQASMIYEAPVEGRTTRLMAFFEDYDELDRIGPVRSSRDYYVYEAMSYDAIYVNWGLAIPFVKDLINSDRVDNVSQALEGIDRPAPEAFARVSRPGYATEFTGYLMVKGYEEAVERLGYETRYRDRFVQAFAFANDGQPAGYPDQPEATKIYPGGTSANNSGYGNANPYFEYDEDDRLYYRYQYGKAQEDERNGEQLAVSNVVFKICHGEVREPSAKDYLAFGVHGEGEAYVFTGGRVIHGTWERDGDYGANLFLDEDGDEIIFNQGKTWICNIWKEYSEYLAYE
ncbi:MAG: DUF3048 domain-containing protein [Clostridium sp.]|jgi:hypothetical protein|nr:DUF3048 domain-containing protein [Clostridium sp.]